MMSNVVSMTMVETLRANESTKEKLLASIQNNLKKVQNVASDLLVDQKLQEDKKEVQQLCESLFRVFSHGLCHPTQGYWQFVKEFTHQKTLEYIQTVGSNKTLIGWSWAWLCVALNENCLESYFHSFAQNPHIIETHYRQPALLRDEQRMQVLITLVAGLEHVPFALKLESEYSEAHLQNILLLKEIDITLDKSCNKESQVTISNSTSLKSLQEGDSGVVDVENSIEVIGCEEKPVCFEESKQINKCDCMDCMRKIDEEQKRISNIINLDMADNSKSKDMEVIHTRIVRRCKVAAKMNDDKNVTFEKCVADGDETENTNMLQSMSDNRTMIKNYNCIGNISTDSGLSIDDKSTPGCDVSESLLFNVNTFQPGLDFKFSIPDIEEKEFNQYSSWWAERKEPEGQEDPSPNVDCLQKETAALKSPDKDTALTDDEVSIYDLNKYCDNDDSSSSRYENDKTECNISVNVAKVQDDDSDSTEDNISSCTLHSDDSDHEKLLNIIEKSDDSLRLSENMLLYLTLEIFELVEEKFYKMFPAFTGYLEGAPEIIFIVMSDKYLYFLRRGNREERLHKEASFAFSEIDYIYVGINYQEFLIVCTDRKKVFQVYTGNHNLTRSIISHLEVAIRRTNQPKLPCVFVDATAHKIYLRKFIAQNLNCEIMTVQLYHYALVHWENYIGHNSQVFSTPAGPHYQGFLMYRFHKNTADSNEPWEAGYFMLKNGVLFCFNSKSEKDVKFYVQLCVPHCKGCRRLPYADRPHVFELIVSKDDSLQLAAADDYDASVWLQSFLQAVCQAGHFFDPEPTYQTCCIVLANDSILTLQGKNYKKMHELLGCANIRDLLHAYVEDDASLCCILEFESGEADRCSGEWILFFGCPDERELFLNVLFYKWEEIYKRELPVTPIKDLSLLEKCKEMSHKLTKERLLSHCIFEELD